MAENECKKSHFPKREIEIKRSAQTSQSSTNFALKIASCSKEQTKWWMPYLVTNFSASRMYIPATIKSQCPGLVRNTSFITDRGLYCYKMMSFDLKNVEGNISAVGEYNIRSSNWEKMQNYIDLFIKSKKAEDLIQYLPQMFWMLQKYKMKLNRLQYTFIFKATDQCKMFLMYSMKKTSLTRQRNAREPSMDSRSMQLTLCCYLKQRPKKFSPHLAMHEDVTSAAKEKYKGAFGYMYFS